MSRSTKNVLISFPRSGRAWTLTICAKLRELLPGGMDHRHSHDSAAVHTFDRYTEDKSSWRGHRVCLVVRDPRDVIVSHWHLLHYRRRGPTHVPGNLFDWSMSKYGLPFVVRFLNDWGYAIDGGTVSKQDVAVIQYEDLKGNPPTGIRTIAEHFGARSSDVTDALVATVIAGSSLTSVRERFAHSNVGPDTRAYSARRGESGVWHEYFTDSQIDEINQYTRQELRGFAARYYA